MKESSTLYHTIICWLILEWWVGEENEQEEKWGFNEWKKI